MAVVIYEDIDFGAGPQRVRTYYPKEVLTREGRAKADRLDDLLRVRLGALVDEFRRAGVLTGPELQKWHRLGRGLQFLGDPSIVDPADLEGRVWLAVRQYLPSELHPSGKGERDRTPRREGHKLDHYRKCFELGRFGLGSVPWLTRWADWDSVFESPGIRRDARIVAAMARHLSARSGPISRPAFRAVLLKLRRVFSTAGTMTDATVMSQEAIDRAVSEAVEAALST